MQMTPTTTVKLCGEGGASSAEKAFARNGEIDFLRFVFAIVVLLFHFNGSFGLGGFIHGLIGVDVFFIVSGFLMAKSVFSLGKNSFDYESISGRTWQYAIRRLRSFYIHYAVVIFLEIVVLYLLINHMGITELVYRLLKSIPSFTLTFMSINGGADGVYVGNTWYLSSMLLSSFLLYPFLLRNYSFSTKVLFPVISVYLFGFLFNKNGLNVGYADWMDFAYFGLLRAIADMSLGCSLFPLAESLGKNRSFYRLSERTAAKWLFTFIKAFCFLIVLFYAYGTFTGLSFGADFQLHAVLICSLGILLSFSNTGYCIPDCKISRLLGRMSFGIFIYHGFIRYSLADYFGSDISSLRVYLLIAMCVIVSVGLMYAVEFLYKKVKSNLIKAD